MPDRQILFITSQPIAPSDGATISMIERLRYLRAAFAWDVRGLCCARLEDRDGLMRTLSNFNCPAQQNGNRLQYEVRGVPVTAILGHALDRFNTEKWQEICQMWEREIAGIRPAVVFSNMRDLPATKAATGYQHVAFMTEDEYPRQGEWGTLPLSPDAIYGRVKCVIVASQFLSDSLQESWGIKARVITNPIELDRFNNIGATRDDFISILHPYPHKGIELFLAIAHCMKDRRFLVTGGLGAQYRTLKPEISRHTNVSLVPYQPDIKAVYERSRLVLVPSLWKEAFSRIVIEACSAGIPVLASGQGGLREAGEDAAIYLPVTPLERGKAVSPQDPLPWVEAILRYDNQEHYEIMKRRALERAARFKEKVKADMIELNNLLGVKAD